MDTSFDVADVCSQEKKAQHADAEKSNKVMQCSFTFQDDFISKRAEALMQLVEEVVKNLVDEEILGQHAPYFARLDQTEKPGFHPVVKIAAHSFVAKLRSMPELSEDIINSRIHSLVYHRLQKHWDNYELYLFPYVKQVKGIGVLQDVIKRTHKVNIDNVMHVLMCFFRNEQPFPEFSQQQWNKELTHKLLLLQQQHKATLQLKLLQKTGMISLKHYENLVLHSLDVRVPSFTVYRALIILSALTSKFLKDFSSKQ